MDINVLKTETVILYVIFGYPLKLLNSHRLFAYMRLHVDPYKT